MPSKIAENRQKLKSGQNVHWCFLFNVLDRFNYDNFRILLNWNKSVKVRLVLVHWVNFTWKYSFVLDIITIIYYLQQ